MYESFFHTIMSCSQSKPLLLGWLQRVRNQIFMIVHRPDREHLKEGESFLIIILRHQFMFCGRSISLYFKFWLISCSNSGLVLQKNFRLALMMMMELDSFLCFLRTIQDIN